MTRREPHVGRTRAEPLTLAWAPASDEPMPMGGVRLAVVLGLILWALLLAPLLLWLA